MIHAILALLAVALGAKDVVAFKGSTHIKVVKIGDNFCENAAGKEPMYSEYYGLKLSACQGYCMHHDGCTGIGFSAPRWMVFFKKGHTSCRLYGGKFPGAKRFVNGGPFSPSPVRDAKIISTDRPNPLMHAECWAKRTAPACPRCENDGRYKKNNPFIGHEEGCECECVRGFTGPTCEEIVPCPGSCGANGVMKGSVAKNTCGCHCDAGFGKWGSGSAHCDNVCEPCENGGVHVKSPHGAAQCGCSLRHGSCPKGFTGHRCEIEVPIADLCPTCRSNGKITKGKGCCASPSSRGTTGIPEFVKHWGGKCPRDYVHITSSWQDCRDAGKALGLTGDAVKHVAFQPKEKDAWGSRRPTGCFQSGNDRVHFNRGAGGSAVGGDRVICKHKLLNEKKAPARACKPAKASCGDASWNSFGRRRYGWDSQWAKKNKRLCKQQCCSQTSECFMGMQCQCI